MTKGDKKTVEQLKACIENSNGLLRVHNLPIGERVILTNQMAIMQALAETIQNRQVNALSDTIQIAKTMRGDW